MPKPAWKTRLLSRSAYLLFSSLLVAGITWWRSTPQRPALPAPDDGVCEVLQIIDGDSLTVNCQGQKGHNGQTHELRLMHIDAPELTQPRWGDKAKQALQALAVSQVTVHFHGKDIYQRDLAVIFPPTQGAEAINLTLVKQGVARVYSRYQPPAEYLTAMKTAKRHGVGIWQYSGLHQDPQRFRRLAH